MWKIVLIKFKLERDLVFCRNFLLIFILLSGIFFIVFRYLLIRILYLFLFFDIYFFGLGVVKVILLLVIFCVFIFCWELFGFEDDYKFWNFGDGLINWVMKFFLVCYFYSIFINLFIFFLLIECFR